MAELKIPSAESVRMHERAKNVLPGGVTGAGRDTKPHSIYFRSGRGAWRSGPAGGRAALAAGPAALHSLAPCGESPG